MASRDRAKGRAPRKLSPTDRHARRIAAVIAKGQAPRSSADLEEYFANSKREVFAAFEGASRHVPPAGTNEPLAIGYRFLLEGLLEHLRYGSDRGYREAAALIAEFQVAVAARAGRIDDFLLGSVTGAMQRARIPVSPELATAVAAQVARNAESRPSLPDMDTMIAEMLAARSGDPFGLVGLLAEMGHAMPGELRSEMAAGLARSGLPGARAAAVLFLLDADPSVRRSIAAALADASSSLSSTDVRRLITMRNWRPGGERGQIDAIVRKARTGGVDCAPWATGGIEAILSSMLDGAAAQGFLLLSPAGRKWRLSSILTKVGIADAWCSEPEARRQIETSLRAAGVDTPMLPVSRSYLDRIVAHHLALGIAAGQTPPVGLLQVAEMIGGADWQPARMEFGNILGE